MNDPYANITDEQILESIKRIQNRFTEPNADGVKLFKEMRDLLIRQGELHFENEIRDHPYGMEITTLGQVDALDKEEEIMIWLRARYDDSQYIIMPRNAQGKYKEHWNWIYFKDKSQAMLFKLTWL